MRKHLLLVVLAALICVPAIGAQAGVGNGKGAVPPGLINAQERITAAIERQIMMEEERYAAKMAGLLLQLDEALLLGDLDLANKIQDRIDSATAKHDEKIAGLQQKLAEKNAAFLLKMAEFDDDGGDDDGDIPPPEEDIPPPPPNTDPVVD